MGVDLRDETAGGPTGGGRARPAPRLAGLRRAVPPLIDASVWAVGLCLFTMLRVGLDGDSAFSSGTFALLAVAAALQLSVGTATQLYRVRWRIGSFEELTVLASTVAAVTGALFALEAMRPRHPLPLSAVVAAGAFTLVVSGGARGLWRLSAQRALCAGPGAEPAVVLGLGQAGMQLVDSLLSTPDSPYRPVALLDDDPAKRNLRVRHLRVQGASTDLARVAGSSGATALIIAVPSASAATIRRLSERAEQAGLVMRVLPPVRELLSDGVHAGSLRPVTPADLLGRRVIETDLASIAGYLTGRRVLVTGAGGSIGSELCRHLVRFAPAQLVMLDRDESALHAVQLSIEGKALLESRNLVVCDIRDRGGLDEVFVEHRPDVVFHAAALKHLPLLEMWPAEAMKTNVAGTLNVLEAAAAHGVSTFVNISTDKAASPVSVLGYSKRLAERLTAGMAERAAGTYLSVRFGNVLGSRGSVLTTFREQIANGGPVTVTDPAVTRFFMTVSEAVELVIQAGAIGRSGELLVLDMGQPVRIAEVAERLIAESGRDLDIVYTGLRPGEKLREDLFGPGECDIRHRHPLISHTSVPPLEPDRVLAGMDPGDARAHMRRLCRVDTSRVVTGGPAQPG